jgi:hypothetical protein
MRCRNWKFLLTVVLAACCHKDTSISKIENIERVFMVDDDRFLVFVRDEGGDVRAQTLWGDTVIVDDVPAGQLAWASKKVEQDSCDHTTTIVLHVHSLADVNGGGKSGQKYGNGMVVEVE